MFTIFIEVFSSLGLFLFGMIFLENQIKISAGHSFKSIVENATSTHFKALLTGFGTTAIFQSSSVVTLMALSLIGAGLMSLNSAIAIIFGANIGTTVTAWIVALVGFKMDIKLLSYIFIGIGGLGSVLSSEEGKWKNYFGILVGFGLIFLGLEGMKDSFSVISKNFDISSYRFSNYYMYAILGLVITSIIQSSSASIAIAQSALFTNMISFEAAAAFVVGANIGTTVTAILGAIGGIPDKKRTALAHLIFNVSTGVVTLLILPWLIWIVQRFAHSLDAVVQIAVFHTLFNVLGVLIWYPFIDILTNFLNKFFKKEELHVTEFIHNVSINIPDLALYALQKEIEHLEDKIEEFALLAINVPPPKALEKGANVSKLLEEYNENFSIQYDKLYDNIRKLEGEIYKFSSKLSNKVSSESEKEQLNKIFQKVNYLATASKSIKDMLYDLDIFYSLKSIEEKDFYKNIRYQILKSVLVFHGARKGDEKLIEEMEEIYKRISLSYKNSIQIIEDIAKNPSVNSHITPMAINDIHLVKSFTKSLRNVLLLFEN
jgi:phosphate:Na+ symporter